MYVANEVDFELYGLAYSDRPLRLEDSIRRTYLNAEQDRIREEIQHSIDTGERLVQEKRVRLPDSKLRWLQVVSEPEYDEDGKPVSRLGVTIDVTERKLHEEHTELLMRELNHRAKNLLAVVQSIANSTARHAPPETLAEDLAQRLQSLSDCQDLLINGNWQAVDLRDLVLSQLGHLSELTANRISMVGETHLVSPTAAQAIGMAVHELTTNALKHGALSDENGRVEISWQSAPADGPETFQMAWRERAGPPVTQPEHSGFGHIVLDRMVSHSVGGHVDLVYAKDGFEWYLEAPLSSIRAS